MSKKLLLLFILILAACGQKSNPPEPLTSGIEVQVSIGPMCPVVQAGDKCPDQPYQAALTILNINREEVMRFKTDENGRYVVNLPPGDYTLVPESPQGMPLPFASEQSFTILPNQITKLTVVYDSGIR